MKQVIKGDEPASFKDWKNKNRGSNWDDFSVTETYEQLRQTLIDEQGRLCCYCEIAVRNNIDAHIEHFKPKSRFPNDMFNVENLFACCRSIENCGHKKQSDYFKGLISPSEDSCHTRFTYTGNGQIIPADENDRNAQETINILFLNSKKLKDLRNTIIKALDNDSFSSELYKASLGNCVEWYNGFYTVIQYVGEKHGMDEIID